MKTNIIKKLASAAMALSLTAALAACGSVGIIGGADGPTKVYVAGQVI